jgi:germination protein M
VESDLRSHLERLLGELLEGPVSEELYPALPSEITVDWVHINDAGLVYVDLTYAGEGEFPSWGSGEEMLAVFSVVNTIIASSPEIESVVLLRNGRQQPTFAGHLDTSRPLLANHQLVASR